MGVRVVVGGGVACARVDCVVGRLTRVVGGGVACARLACGSVAGIVHRAVAGVICGAGSMTRRRVPVTRRRVPVTRRRVPVTRRRVPVTRRRVPVTRCRVLVAMWPGAIGIRMLRTVGWSRVVQLVIVGSNVRFVMRSSRPL
jgi:hypothetical protein